MRLTSPDRPVVHLAASAGGHLDLLSWVQDAFREFDCVWVVPSGPRAYALVASGETVREIPDTGRRLGTFLSNLRASFSVILRDRPRVVVTSGAGCVVAFAVLSRIVGAKVIFVETMARVTNPSKSGRLLSRVATEVFVQWPDMQRIYRGSTVCRPALCEDVAPPSRYGEGTFVAVGTHGEPFDRLLKLVDEAAGAGLLPGPIVAQTGVSTYQPCNFVPVPWLEPAELELLVERSRYVVCHAGSGLISGALRAGRRPLVLARLQRYGEHFDDHQLQLSTRLGELGLVVQLTDSITAEDLHAADAGPAPAELADTLPSVEQALADTLAGLVVC